MMESGPLDIPPVPGHASGAAPRSSWRKDGLDRGHWPPKRQRRDQQPRRVAAVASTG